ncbi:MAG: hypothetical protein R8K50_09670 [Mariprofundus sp.]
MPRAHRCHPHEFLLKLRSDRTLDSWSFEVKTLDVGSSGFAERIQSELAGGPAIGKSEVLAIAIKKHPQ